MSDMTVYRFKADFGGEWQLYRRFNADSGGEWHDSVSF